MKKSKIGMRMVKKGAMEAETLVKIIILVLGFSILLFVYVQLSWQGNVDKKICHESVILRGTLPMMAQGVVSLKCRTENVCVTSGLFAGECESFNSSKSVTTMKVSDKTAIEKVIAQKVVECWQMMGEGKLSLFSQKMAQVGLGTVSPTCVVCSRIAFDTEKLSKTGIDLGSLNVPQYMRTRIMPDTNVTYERYFTKDSNPIQIQNTVRVKDLLVNTSSKGEVKVAAGGADEEIAIYGAEGNSDLKSKDLAVLFVQISAPKHGEVFANSITALGLGLGTSFMVAPVKTFSVARSAVASPWVMGALAIVGITQQGVTWYNRDIAAGYCGEVVIGDEARDGCSAVRAVTYNPEAMSQYCINYEGIQG